MLLLVVGAKGGVGATTLALHLCRLAGAVPLDAADGRLAVELSGPGVGVLDLAETPPWTVGRRSRVAEQVVRVRQPLLWTPACGVWREPVAAFVGDIAALGHVVADGGIAPPANLVDLAAAVIIVSADDDLARWHEARLKQAWPQARAVVGDLRATAQALAEQLLGVPARRSLLARARRPNTGSA
jgi:hypothetical protein